MNFDEPILRLDRVGKTYDVPAAAAFGTKRAISAVDAVTLDVRRGETLGLVGESGSGKSSLARLMVRLDDPTHGKVRFLGTDLAGLSGSELKRARRQFQMVFQDPYASLNPRMRIRAIIAEPLVNFRLAEGLALRDAVERIAAEAGIAPALLDRFPTELSGGQCQRVGIARAIALRPALIVADEPVSALDVSIRAQILNLIARIKKDMGLTLVFVSHDLSVVGHVSDRVAIMYLGRIVEIGPTASVFENPAHPYTRTLLAAAPRPLPGQRGVRQPPMGEAPSPLDPPSGCRFRTRCAVALPRCAVDVPIAHPVDGDGGHRAACHLLPSTAGAPASASGELQRD